MNRSILATVLGVLGLSTAAGASPPHGPACGATALPPTQADWPLAVHEDAPGQFSLFLPEAAEGFLGRAVFDSLADRFAAVPGVVHVEHQDRESFLVQAPGLAADRLQASLWTAFVAAAADACGPGRRSVEATAASRRKPGSAPPC